MQKREKNQGYTTAAINSLTLARIIPGALRRQDGPPACRGLALSVEAGERDDTYVHGFSEKRMLGEYDAEQSGRGMKGGEDKTDRERLV